MVRRVFTMALLTVTPGLAVPGQAQPASEASAPPSQGAPLPGRVAGAVLFKGAKPEGTRFDFRGEERGRCGTFKRLYDYRVTSGSRLRGVVLWLEGVARGLEGSPTTHKLTMRRCEIEPRAVDASVGDTLVLANRDSTPFRPHLRWPRVDESQDPRRRPRRMWIPGKDQQVALPLTQTGVLEIKNRDGAAWQTSWLRVFDHGFHTRTDDRGAFSLEGIPPGTYVLHAWDPHLGEAQLMVEVLPARTSLVNIPYGPDGAIETKVEHRVPAAKTNAAGSSASAPVPPADKVAAQPEIP